MSLEEKQNKEHDLWAAWKAGDQKALPDLFKSFRPIENTWISKVTAHNVPESAVRGEIKRIMYNSFEKYQPNKNVKLSTFVNSQMPKLYRYVSERQNIGRIPEHRSLRITTFTQAKSLLSDKLGRDPNAVELSDELTWSLPEVERMTRELGRRDLILTEEFGDFSFNNTSNNAQVLNLAYYELDPREKKVFEWITGFGGKRKKNTKEIAKALKVSEPTVGNIRKRMARKIEKYIK